MEIISPVLIGRLIVCRHPRRTLYVAHRRPRKLHSSCSEVKARSSKALMCTSMAYLNTSSNGRVHPARKHMLVNTVPARFQSSKTSKSDRAVKKISNSTSSSWSDVYQRLGLASNAVQKKLMDGMFSPLLAYGVQVVPKVSHGECTVLRCKSEESRDSGSCDTGNKGIGNGISNQKLQAQELQEEIHSSYEKDSDRMDGNKRVNAQKTEHLEFHSIDTTGESVNYWVKMPSLKKFLSASAATEMGLSAIQVLQRTRKFGDATVVTETQLKQDDMSQLNRSERKTDIKASISHQMENEMDSKVKPSVMVNDTLHVHASDQTNKSMCTSAFTRSRQSATDLMSRIPSISTSGAFAVLKKIGSTSSTLAAINSETPTVTGYTKDNSNVNVVHKGGSASSTLEYKTMSHSTETVEPENDVSCEMHNTKQTERASYVYNNYNLKYIQVNLFKLPDTLFQLRRKKKPAPTMPLDEDTTYFDSDVPLLDMTQALSSKKAGSKSSPEATAQAGVVNRKYAEVAVKMKDEKARQKAAEENNVKKPVRPVISKANIDARTKSLAIGVSMATSNASRLLKLERLCNHLNQYPESRHVAVKERLIPALLKAKQSKKDATTLAHVHQMLAQLGYASPVPGRGVRILAVDGGGTRGIIPIEILRELERQAKQPIHEMFDYWIGVSSGAVLAFLLALARASLETCEQLYKEMSVEVFNRNTLLGTSKLFFNHAYYDTDAWMQILREHMHGVGQTPAIEMSQDPTCPKVSAVATLMNSGSIKNFLFRNYNLPVNTSSFYQGSSKYKLSEALRASSAAPGYFEEYKLDDFVFQDGGILTNNPSALSLHESKLLWPDTPIQCLVSLGTGRYDPVDEGIAPELSSLKKKLTQLMISATDTESVHTVLQDLLPSGSYFRFNPSLSEDFLLDENRPDKIDQLQQEALDYVSVNELRIMQAGGVLTREKSTLQKSRDWIKLQQDIYR